MKITSNEFDIKIVKTKVFKDFRGEFNKVWLSNVLEKEGIINAETYFSSTKKGILRGLHHQEGETAQGKFLTCLSGKILDIAVDLRKDSSTFGRVFTHKLSAFSGEAIHIPAGFAHGFFSIEDSIIVNFCDREYSPENEVCINWRSIQELQDLEVTGVSEKDELGLSLKEYLSGYNHW